MVTLIPRGGKGKQPFFITLPPAPCPPTPQQPLLQGKKNSGQVHQSPWTSTFHHEAAAAAAAATHTHTHTQSADRPNVVDGECELYGDTGSGKYFTPIFSFLLLLLVGPPSTPFLRLRELEHPTKKGGGGSLGSGCDPLPG